MSVWNSFHAWFISVYASPPSVVSFSRAQLMRFMDVASSHPLNPEVVVHVLTCFLALQIRWRDPLPEVYAFFRGSGSNVLCVCLNLNVAMRFSYSV